MRTITEIIKETSYNAGPIMTVSLGDNSCFITHIRSIMYIYLSCKDETRTELYNSCAREQITMNKIIIGYPLFIVKLVRIVTTYW